MIIIDYNLLLLSLLLCHFSFSFYFYGNREGNRDGNNSNIESYIQTLWIANALEKHFLSFWVFVRKTHRFYSFGTANFSEKNC
jgi:hypothetical protein